MISVVFVVVNKNNLLLGTISDGDLRQAILKNNKISNKNKLASENRKWIKDTKCRCTYECANSTNALFNTNMLPGLIKTIYKDLTKKNL